MLLTLNSVKLLTVVCLCYIAGRGECRFVIPYAAASNTDDFGICEDTSSFIYDLTQLPSDQAFQVIISILDTQPNPPEVSIIRQKLLVAVQTGELHIDNVIAQLDIVPSYNKYDVLITTLMTISEYIDKNSSIHDDLEKLLFYVLRRRFLGQNSTSIEDRSQTSIYSNAKSQQFSLQTVQSSKPNNCYIGSLVEVLLNRIVQLSLEKIRLTSAASSSSSSSSSSSTSSSSAVQISSDVTVVQYTVDDLIPLIPKPKFDTELINYQKFVEIMKSEEVQHIMQTIDRSKYKTKEELMDVILTTITKTITRKDVQDVVSLYSNYKLINKVGFNYGTLVNFLPTPKSEQEIVYYNMIKSLLTSEEIYTIVQQQHLHFDDNANLQDILYQLIKQLVINKQISTSSANAFNYYLSVIEGRQRLNIDFNELAVLLPKPTSPEFEAHYNILKSIFESNEIYMLIQNEGNLTTVSDKQELLKQVLLILMRNSSNQSITTAARYYLTVITVQKYGFNYFDLLNMLNVSETDRHFRDVIEFFMFSAEFDSILSKLNLISMTNRQKLVTILTAIASSTTEESILMAAHRFLRVIYQEDFNLIIQKILELLPQPRTDEEKQKFIVITQFLTSDEGYDLLHEIDRSVFPDDKLLAEHYFKIVLESKVAGTIQESFKYYYDLMEQLEEVEFVTRKEIKKNFKLHEIFSDALNLHNLNITQKAAFIAFYKYISKVNPQAISQFASWDNASTRGQFTKLIFDYVLNQPTTPSDIKNNILMLVPLVQMEGKAALPP